MKLFIVLALLGINVGALAQQKSAVDFVYLLETHDYWKQGLKTGSPRDNPQPLSKLLSQNPKLGELESYDRIHMDYGNPVKARDDMHEFTILELRFKDRTKIPFANSSSRQIYPDCCGKSSFRDLNSMQKERVFPLWEYKELEHSGYIRWEHQEYIEWYAIRIGPAVYILYTIPVANMDDLGGYFDLLGKYLSAKTNQEMQDFIRLLESNKSSSPIAYDAVEDLQGMLARSGFDPGPVDGLYGGGTRRALISLLAGLEYMDAGDDNMESLREALSAFQKDHNLLQTGRFEKPTIDLLEEVLVDQRR